MTEGAMLRLGGRILKWDDQYPAWLSGQGPGRQHFPDNPEGEGCV